MKKIWVKFLKDYNDGTNDFKKDLIVEVGEDDGNALLKLKIVEKTDAPNLDMTKVLEQYTTTLVKKIEEGLNAVFDKLNKNLTGKTVNITSLGRNIDNDGMWGFKSTGEFVDTIIQCSKPGAKEDDRITKAMEPFRKAPSGQHTQDDVEGGFLIAPTIVNEIWEFMKETESLMERADMRQTSGQTLEITRMPESSRKEPFRHGGAVAYWTHEADQFTASVLKWGRMRLQLHKLTALFYATDEELADARIALEPQFTKGAGRAISFKVNEAMLTGTGAGMPLGVLNSPALITVPLELNQEPNTILHKNINKMYHRMHPVLRSNAVWLAHPNLIEQLEYIVFINDTVNNHPIYMPPGGLTERPFGVLKGRPVIPCEYCFDYGQRGDIIFADYSQYAMLRKAGGDGGIKSASSMHVRFLFEEMAFRFSFRIDGQPLWSAPIEDYRGTTKRGPFITLANRSGESSSSGL